MEGRFALLAQRKKTGLRINHSFLHLCEALGITCWRGLVKDLRAYAFQAPTLIGCSIVKERATREAPKRLFLLLPAKSPGALAGENWLRLALKQYCARSRETRL